MADTDRKTSFSGHVEEYDLVKAGDKKHDTLYDEPDLPPPSLAGMTDQEIKALGRKATWKMDCVVMPTMTILYILNYLDRQNIAAAKLATIMEDLSLSVQQYNTAVSILFVGYILMQVPSNLVVSKIKWPAAYICLAVALWGAVSAATAAVQSFGGLLACRFVLGVVEAAFFPGAFYYLSMFYNRKQLAFRTAILYSGSQLGNAFGNLLALAIMELEGAHGIEGWRWLFIIEGVATVGIGAIFAVIMPNAPSKIRMCSQQEIDWIKWNYESDMKSEDNAAEVTALQGFLMAVKDPKTWMLCGILYATYTAGAVNNFFPTVVDGLGFDRNTSYGLTAPPFILCVICMLINGWHSDKTQERFLHIALPLVVTFIANVIAVATTNIGARYFAMMLLPASFYSSAIVQLSWISGSLSQPSVKRAASIAFINSMCNTPNIWTAYLYYDSPRYVVAFAVNLGAAIVAIGFATFTFLHLRRANRKLEQGLDLGKHGPTRTQLRSGFRYLL
ncbi:hypothetical protein MBLNU230_g3889t1 [Neophaeotheca triangularis]